MIPSYVLPVLNHVWQSTLIAAVAAMLTVLLKSNRAPAQHWVWLTASMKFLIPFSLLVAVGARFGWSIAPARFSMVVEQFGRPLAQDYENAVTAANSGLAGPPALVMLDTPVQAQSPDVSAPKFEGAPIHPARQDDEHSSQGDKSRWLAHNLTLKRLIAGAYDINDRLIFGGPKWVGSNGYDIDAKIPRDLALQTRNNMPLMLQSPLAERFHLVIHREPYQVPGYLLMVARGGPKMLHPDTSQKRLKIHSTDGHLVAQNVTMEAFAELLSHNRDVGGLVVDGTALWVGLSLTSTGRRNSLDSRRSCPLTSADRFLPYCKSSSA
jgi:uncharacterized protein (TIGR03435 family)